ncbi:MAG TPA: ligand-binding protein SH3 [Candidatus Omnitrophica bacterium]|nr:ligand-binding protein SH3 [Candidatus Omnitrophota bacterium]
MIKEFIVFIYTSLSSFITSRELLTVILASLPIIEARYAIPISYVLMDLSLSKVFILSIIGNMLPVIPLLLFLEPISRKLRRFRLWCRFFDRLAERTRKRAYLIQKYETLGLILFVSIPLPVTGAWTGALAASIFKIKFRYAFLAILVGVVIASLFISILVLLGKGLYWLERYHF